MIPDQVVVVDRIPVTPGGEKVDKKAIAGLAAQLAGGSIRGTHSAAPAGA
jgi:non-ribosomal peptide synthetase component E (peptide arylation enzyme)